MRILLFIIWVTLGIVYFLIWSQRNKCCDPMSVSTELSLKAGPEKKLESTQLPLGAQDSNVGQHKAGSPADPMIGAATNAVASKPIILGQNCITFNWGESNPVSASCFAGWRDSILKSVLNGQQLELIGSFFEKENQVMAGGDLGLLRASKVKDLFTGLIADDKIKIRSLGLGDTAGKLGGLTTMIHTRAVFMNDQVKELDDKTLIYFKFASNAGLNDAVVNDYIDYLSRKHKSTNDQILIIGHTDDDATAETNLNLGHRRAQIIKNLLINKGIKASRIKTDSKGEEQPIAPNDTEENRKLNRRVEIIINPVPPPNNN